MAGRLNAQDVSGKHRKACIELADAFGFERTEVWDMWRQIAMAIEYELEHPRAVAEWLASDAVRRVIDKRGSQPS